jgi:signal transduction histidine kinase
MGVREDRRAPAKPAGLLARFRARGVRDLRDLDVRDRLGHPPQPLRLAAMVFVLVLLLGAMVYVLARTENSWFGLVVTAVGVFGIAVAVGGALAVTQYRHLQDLDRARDELLDLHARIDALQQASEGRLHDARAIIGAMSAALHALRQSGDTPEIAAALGEELDRLRQVLTATRPAILVRVPAAVVCRSVESFARLREVRLIVDVPSDLMLMVDPTGITQILRNLIDNARKYAPGSPVRIGCEPAGPFARIFIEDDGPGIDAAVAETLFQSGVRGGSDAQGSGRGLAVARRLAEDMQGSLWFEPRNGGGARFVLKLRVAELEPVVVGEAPS